MRRRSTLSFFFLGRRLDSEEKAKENRGSMSQGNARISGRKKMHLLHLSEIIQGKKILSLD